MARKRVVRDAYFDREVDGYPCCCGIAILANLFVRATDRIGYNPPLEPAQVTLSEEVINKFKREFNDDLESEGVSRLQAVTSHRQVLVEDTLKRCGWRKIQMFTNSSTGNKLTVWSYAKQRTTKVKDE